MNEVQVNVRRSTWHSLWMLLGLRLRIQWNQLKRKSVKAKIGTGILVLLILAAMGFAFFLSWKILAFMRSPELAAQIGDVSPLMRSLPALMLSAVAGLVFLTNFGVLLQTLYLSGDLDFLLTAPLPMRAVFLSKMLLAILPTLGLAILFVVPLMFGLGSSFGYHWLYYPAVILVLILLTLATVSLVSLPVMLVVRIFPARRVAEVLGFVVGVGTMVFSQSARFIRVEDEQVTQTLRSMSTGAIQTPLNWMGDALVAVGEANWLAAVPLMLLTTAVLVAIFYASLLVCERLYYAGWSNLQNFRTKKVAAAVHPAREETRVRGLARFLPPPVRALMLKDFLVLRRDLQNLTQLLTPIILGVIYAASMLSTPARPNMGEKMPALVATLFRATLAYGDVFLGMMLCWMFVARLGEMGFSMEGKNYWMLKTAPVSAAHLLLAKYLVAFIPSMVTSVVYVLVLELVKRGSIDAILVAVVSMVLVSAGMSGIFLAFGVRGANFEWDNPRQMGSRSNGCLGALVTILVMPVCFILFVGPVVGAALLQLPLAYGQILGLLLGGGLMAVCAILPPRMVLSQVERLNEN